MLKYLANQRLVRASLVLDNCIPPNHHKRLKIARFVTDNTTYNPAYWGWYENIPWMILVQMSVYIVLIQPATTIFWGKNSLRNLYYINLLETLIIGVSHLESKVPVVLFSD